jgi:hypothetical protein
VWSATPGVVFGGVAHKPWRRTVPSRRCGVPRRPKPAAGPVIRPHPAAALRGLPTLLDRPLVARLNELQGFLSANGEGLSLDVLRDIYAAATYPLGVVGRGPR